MASNDELERWWNGLTAEEKSDAISSRDAGRLSDTLEESLQKAGLIERGNRKDRSIPGDVGVFLKTRH